jgi:hypothetical protein
MCGRAVRTGYRTGSWQASQANASNGALWAPSLTRSLLNSARGQLAQATDEQLVASQANVSQRCGESATILENRQRSKCQRQNSDVLEADELEKSAHPSVVCCG